jgi:hypothetical protein
MLHKELGEVLFFSWNVFVTTIIVGVAHSSLYVLLNRKLLKVPRFIFVVLLMVSFIGGVYFDYRATSNYTKTLMDDKKNNMLKEGVDTSVVTASNTKKQIDTLRAKIDRLEKINSNNQNRIAEIDKKIDIYDSIITAYAKKKKHTKTDWLNKRTAEKNKRSAKEDKERIQGVIDKNEESIKSIQAQITALTGNLKGELETLDKKMSHEQFNRLMFLFIIIFVLEFLSYLPFIMDFVIKKSIDKSKISEQEIEEIKSIADSGAVMKDAVTKLKIDLTQSVAKDMELNRVSLQAMRENAHIANMTNIATTIDTTNNMALVGKVTSDIVKKASKGIVQSYESQALKEVNKVMQEEIHELSHLNNHLYSELAKAQRQQRTANIKYKKIRGVKGGK